MRCFNFSFICAMFFITSAGAETVLINKSVKYDLGNTSKESCILASKEAKKLAVADCKEIGGIDKGFENDSLSIYNTICTVSLKVLCDVTLTSNP